MYTVAQTELRRGFPWKALKMLLPFLFRFFLLFVGSSKSGKEASAAPKAGPVSKKSDHTTGVAGSVASHSFLRPHLPALDGCKHLCDCAEVVVFLLLALALTFVVVMSGLDRIISCLNVWAFIVKILISNCA